MVAESNGLDIDTDTLMAEIDDLVADLEDDVADTEATTTTTATADTPTAEKPDADVGASIVAAEDELELPEAPNHTPKVGENGDGTALDLPSPPSHLPEATSEVDDEEPISEERVAVAE